MRLLVLRRNRGTFSVGASCVVSSKTAFERRKNIAAGDKADEFWGLIVAHDRQAADVVADHVIDGLASRRVFVDEFGQPGDEIFQWRSVGGFGRLSKSRRVSTPTKTPSGSTIGKPW